MIDPAGPEEYQVIFEPVGRRVQVPRGATLLEAAQNAGVELIATCGGEGICGDCRVRPGEGSLSQPSQIEQDELDEEELAEGLRLACQTQVYGPLRVDVPPTSLASTQRLQLEGLPASQEIDPLVTRLALKLDPPSLDDLRPDDLRTAAALRAAGLPDPEWDLAVLAQLPVRMRALGWEASLAVRGRRVVGVLPREAALFGLAADLGTTKLAAYLVNLETGETVARAGVINPQIVFGEDVISRIAYSASNQDGGEILQTRLVQAISGLTDELCREAGVEREQIVEAVLVGNTAIHHLLAGLPVEQLGASPYAAAVGGALEFPARQVGLKLAPGAVVYMPPNIAGFVGADHIAMLLATGFDRALSTTLAMDIGTNTEVSLYHQGRHLSCSCASGPAFEGAHIRDGMRAAPGAIERMRLNGDQVQLYTISSSPPVGICGSGILDLVAQLLDGGLLNPRGAFTGSHPRLVPWDDRKAFLLSPGADSGNGKDILATRQDVNEIQLAKAAIRAGVEVLLEEAGIEASAIERFVVAGAFGTYLDLESAVRVGMFPPLPRDRFEQAGNAAGAGAQMLLLSAASRRTAAEIAARVEYIELTIHRSFTEKYMEAMWFEVGERS